MVSLKQLLNLKNYEISLTPIDAAILWQLKVATVDLYQRDNICIAL